MLLYLHLKKGIFSCEVDVYSNLPHLIIKTFVVNYHTVVSTASVAFLKNMLFIQLYNIKVCKLLTNSIQFVTLWCFPSCSWLYIYSVQAVPKCHVCFAIFSSHAYFMQKSLSRLHYLPNITPRDSE